MGPLNDAMKKRIVEQMGDIKCDITWTTLSEYLQDLERRGISTNVASFIGATTIREHVIGLEDEADLSSSSGCARSCKRRWRRARWASARRSSTRRRSTRRPRS